MTTTMKVPRVGDRLILDKDWLFDLYNEYRNDSIFDLHSMKYKGVPRDTPQALTLPAGTLLEISRVYIRQGNKSNDNNEYDSLTFRLLWHPTIPYEQLKAHAVAQPGAMPAVRFWAKIDDCNSMQITWDPPTPQGLKDVEAKSDDKKRKKGKRKIAVKRHGWLETVGHASFKTTGHHTWFDKLSERNYGWRGLFLDHNHLALHLLPYYNSSYFTGKHMTYDQHREMEAIFAREIKKLLKTNHKMGRPPLVREVDHVTGNPLWYTAWRGASALTSGYTGNKDPDLWNKVQVTGSINDMLEAEYQDWLSANGYEPYEPKHDDVKYLDAWISKHNAVIKQWLTAGKQCVASATKQVLGK